METKKLEQVIEKVRQLPEEQQAALAELIEGALEDIREDIRWQVSLASPASQVLLSRMADEALKQHRAGKTKPLDI